MDHSVSCWNQSSVQFSFPIVCSSGVSRALPDKSGAFSLGDVPGFSSAVYLSKQQSGIQCMTTQPFWLSCLVALQALIWQSLWLWVRDPGYGPLPCILTRRHFSRVIWPLFPPDSTVLCSRGEILHHQHAYCSNEFG